MDTKQAQALIISILQTRGTAGVIFTNHASARMAERDISEGQVIDTLQSEDIKPLRGNRDFKFKVCDEDFAVVFATQGGQFVIVITVWRQDESTL